MKFKLFFTKYVFWLVITGLIIGVYGYGIWFRYNTLNNLDELVENLFSADVPFLNTEGLLHQFGDMFTDAEKFTEFKATEVYQLMSLPQKFQFNLAFATKRTLPFAIMAIILIALIMRTKFSATIDVYKAERQATLDNIRNEKSFAIENKMPDDKQQIQTLKEDLVEPESNLMDVF